MKSQNLFIAFALTLSLVLGTVLRSSAEESRVHIYTEISPPVTVVLDNGILDGLGVKVVEAIQKRIGRDDDIQIVPWARGYKFLTERKNILLFPTTRTPERENLFRWVGPLVTIRWMFYGHSDKVQKIQSLSEAKSVKRIGVYREDIRAQFLKKEGFRNLDVADTQFTNYRKLLRKRVDLVAASDIGMRYFLKNNSQYKNVLVPVYTFNEVQLYLAFSKKTAPETVDLWRKAFIELDNDGVIDRLRQQWM